MEYLRKLFVPIEVPSLRRLNERRKKNTAFTILAILVSVAGPVFANTEGRPIDDAHSTMTVYVYKTGILSGLAHNHEIEAPIESGEVNNSERPSVELRVNSGELRVLDPEVSDGTRAKIQATMQSAEVLDVGQFPEIHFQSTGVEAGRTANRSNACEDARANGKKLGRPKTLVNRERILELQAQGHSLRQISATLGVGYGTVRARLPPRTRYSFRRTKNHTSVRTVALKTPAGQIVAEGTSVLPIHPGVKAWGA